MTWSVLFRYDPSIGIYGMDFYVVLGRPGMNIPHRYVHRQKRRWRGWRYTELAQHSSCGEDRHLPFPQSEYCLSLGMLLEGEGKTAVFIRTCKFNCLSEIMDLSVVYRDILYSVKRYCGYGSAFFCRLVPDPHSQCGSGSRRVNTTHKNR